MSPDQISLVKSSWQQVLPIKDTAAQLFYTRLFELDPGLRGLFRDDMVEQGRKLMTMINTVVNHLDQLEPILGSVEDLGRRHAGYGVKDHDYDTVGEPLIWTLGQGLGEHFTPPVKLAWVNAYTTLSATMKQAAHTVT